MLWSFSKRDYGENERAHSSCRLSEAAEKHNCAENIDRLAVVADVDFESGMILDVDGTKATNLGKRFVLSMMKGYCLLIVTEALLEEIVLIFGHLKKALLTAIKELGRRYSELNKGNRE